MLDLATQSERSHPISIRAPFCAPRRLEFLLIRSLSRQSLTPWNHIAAPAIYAAVAKKTSHCSVEAMIDNSTPRSNQCF